MLKFFIKYAKYERLRITEKVLDGSVQIDRRS